MFILYMGREHARAIVFPNVLIGHDDDADYIEGGDFDSGSDACDASYESEPEPDHLPTESKSRQKHPQMEEDGRMDVTKNASRGIDAGNYVVFVRKTENRVSTI